MPAAFDSSQDVFLGDVFYPGLAIVLWIVSVDDPVDSVLRLAKPAFFEILEDCFGFRFGACYVACIGNGD